MIILKIGPGGPGPTPKAQFPGASKENCIPDVPNGCTKGDRLIDE